ncbi:ABC transporter ATP-binding protein [Azospirillum rugosum]|uniref:NitT/TauT family transport system ATP-binding protein n=1 Tax=Azospirillum rugosum TaxID=416170 RepID=A0ABS4SJY7_9PROT|nr:ABC transporter ATP-binding protein [Azospirillum rugosum]MBP2292875.1 NitT/TauT family transport system ATP-binding protein [Azospirillum rugosum]MDQ0529373.1 NitT/TauT family transport system ATP-binding protein [Azospirillum rugosum]
MSFVSIDSASYDVQPGQSIVDRIDWTIPAGEFHCLVGRSGCGKTTLLKLAAGLLQPTAGAIRIRGNTVREPSPEVGFVFQTPTLLEWHTALDNVLLPLSLKRRPRPEDRRKAEELLDLVGLSGLEGRHPRALSGGQQSRVAIARALITEPALLLLDEPFAALDAITREELQDDLLRLCALRGTTVLFVTHDIAEAIYLADRVAVMEAGRLHHTLAVDLPRPRGREARYSPRFTALCRELRRAMDGAPVQPVPLDAAS